MIINMESLARLYTGFTAVFNAAFQETQTWYERVAMTVPANTRIMDYKFLLDFPMVREWIGDSEVDRNDIEDDQLGFYNPIVAALAQEARKHPERLIADLLLGGFSTACYDGQNFFAATHPVGAGTVSNFGGGSGTGWYLMDTSRAVKPFIFQLRREVQLVRMDRQDDEHAFMRKKMRYGVDYRGAAAFGLWQLAYACKETLNDTNYAAARAAMMSVSNAEGRPLGMKPNLLLVPPSLEAQAREILQAQFIIGDPLTGGARTNVWQGTADLLVVPELA